MKKSLSLVLALVMILGSFSTVFAAEATAVEKAGEFLNEKGILSGYAGSKDLGLEDNLLRQDTLVLVAKLLGEFDEAKAHKGEVTYEDVNDKTYVPLAAWAKENNTFVGHSDAKFGFGENLKAQEYAKVLLTALGYKVAPNGDSDIKWADALAKAKEFGILADVKVENATEITRGEMAVMTFNALGVTMKGSKETLADKLGIKMPAAEVLEAKVKDTENLAEIVVELSNADLVKNKEALTTPNNYRVNIDDVKVYNVDVEGDNVILTLTPYGNVEDYPNFNDTLIKGKKFDLTIRNIDSKINKTYKGITANDNAIPAVENVEFMGDYGIKVTTSEPIANPLERNFRLDTRTSMVVEQYGRDIILTPYHGGAFDKDADQLTVDKLVDFAGYMSATTFEDMELSTDDALPKVEAAYRSGDKLTVVFDRDIYHDSIAAYKNRRETGNVSFVERRVTFYAETAEKIDANVAVYTFEREIPRGIEVEISGVANHFNKVMETVVETTVDYKDEYAPTVVTSTKDVEITEADNTRINTLVAGLTKAKEIDAKLDEKTAGVLNREVNTQEMTITFDKDIAEFKVASNETKAQVIARIQANLDRYFTLYELDVTRRGEVKDVDLTVSDIKADQIKLTFEGIKVNNSTRDFDYVLEVKDFTDLNRNRMDREYLDFQVIRIDDAFSVKVEGVYPESYYNRNGVEIRLEFNDFVNKTEAANAKNYYLDGKLKVNEAIVERDGKTVSLVVYDTTVAKLKADYEILEISPRVQNLDDDLLAHRFFYIDGRGEATDPSKVAGEVKKLADAIAAADAAMKDLVVPTSLEDANVAAAKEARILVDAAKVLGAEDADFANLGKLTAAETKIEDLKQDAADAEAADKLAAAQRAVNIAQALGTQADVNTAKELVDALADDVDEKAGLLSDLADVQDIIDLAAANNDIALAIAALNPKLDGEADAATKLILGDATHDTVLTWSSNNTAILTNAGVGVSDGTGGTAELTATVNKTVNGQAGTAQTKVYDVVVNANGTLKSITAQ